MILSHQGTNGRQSGVKLWAVLAIVLVALSAGCQTDRGNAAPWIQFTRVPRAGPGGTDKKGFIAGIVRRGRPGQRIVLYARSGKWWVQPLVNQPFTEVRANSKWINVTHMGTEYAALLVDPRYRPEPTIDALPQVGAGVAAVAVVPGSKSPPETWWFRLSVVTVCMLGVIAVYRFRWRQLTATLNLRFQERLAERTRIAQELHDTLLQGFLSASMQVHVASDALPPDSPAKPTLVRALRLMAQVIDEGRNAVRGLRASDGGTVDLAYAFSLIQEELDPGVNPDRRPEFRVIVDGQQRPLHPLLGDEVYRIGREALINAFRHSRASHIEIELRYSSSQLRMFVRDDGAGIDPKTVVAGRDGHWGLLGMRERADRISGKLNVFSGASRGTEIDLIVPGYLAFRDYPRRRMKWFGAGSHPGERTDRPAIQNRKAV